MTVIWLEHAYLFMSKLHLGTRVGHLVSNLHVLHQMFPPSVCFRQVLVHEVLQDRLHQDILVIINHTVRVCGTV